MKVGRGGRRGVERLTRRNESGEKSKRRSRQQKEGSGSGEKRNEC